MTTNETTTATAPEPETDGLPEIHTVSLPEPPMNILPDPEETEAPARLAYLILVDHSSYQHIVGVALDRAEAEEFVRIANKGRYGELMKIMPIELLALPALWSKPE